MATSPFFIKDPDEVLDYKFDFAALTNGSGAANYLQSGETISSHTVTVSSGLTKDSDDITDTNTSVTVWLSGGTVAELYTVTCNIDTSAGRTVERSIYVDVREK